MGRIKHSPRYLTVAAMLLFSACSAFSSFGPVGTLGFQNNVSELMPPHVQGRQAVKGYVTYPGVHGLAGGIGVAPNTYEQIFVIGVDGLYSAAYNQQPKYTVRKFSDFISIELTNPRIGGRSIMISVRLPGMDQPFNYYINIMDDGRNGTSIEENNIAYFNILKNALEASRSASQPN